MDKSALLRVAGPGMLPETPVFVASMVAILFIFGINLWADERALRIYVLYVLPLLAIGMHSSRRWHFVSAALLALTLEAVTFLHFHVSWLSLVSNMLLEAFVAMLCFSVADTARDAYLKVLNLARTDDLTGLMNRRAFVRTAALEIERQARYGGEFSMLLLDLDGFKALNDTHGHFIGDVALRTLAEAIRNNTRRSDSVARLGGDEFVVLMPNTPKGACASICQQLRGAVAAGMTDSGHAITASIGSVTFEHPPESVDAALRLADEAMYRAKHNGGNCVVTA